MINRIQMLLRPTTWQVGCILAVVMAFYFTSARAGHNWGGDFSQYILHAQNILEGQPYTAIGVDSKPNSPLGPKGYPPAYPLSMVPLLGLFGLNFVVLKCQIVLYFGIGLFFYWLILRNYLSTTWALGALLWMAISPWTLKFSNNVLSDIPFFAASLAAIWAIDRFTKNSPTPAHAALVAFTLLLACLFRSVGTILIIAFVIHTLLNHRTHVLYALVISGIALVATSTVSQSFGLGGSYASQFTTDLDKLIVVLQKNVLHFKRSLIQYLALYPSRNEQSLAYLVINNSVLISFLALTITGLIYNLYKRGVALWDIYMAGYVGLLLIYPYPVRARYLIPIMPFLIFYAILGFRIASTAMYLKFRRHFTTRFKRAVLRLRYLYPSMIYLPLFLIFSAYFTFYPTAPGANILKDPDTAHLFDTIKKSTPDISGVFFWRPRVLRLFTNVRTAGFYNLNEVTWPQLNAYAQEYDISHIILDAHNTKFNHLVTQHQAHAQPIYQNGTFKIYKISDLTQVATRAPR